MRGDDWLGMGVEAGVGGPRVDGQPGDVRNELTAALSELYRYASRLAGGDRSLAEDLTQESCLSLAAEMQSGRSAVITIGWLKVVCRRRFIDHIRRNGRRVRETTTGEIEPWDEPQWQLIEGGTALDCLASLTDDQRAALVFRYVDDLAVAEVAELLGRSLAATDSLLARARRSLAQAVQEVHRD